MIDNIPTIIQLYKRKNLACGGFFIDFILFNI